VKTLRRLVVPVAVLVAALAAPATAQDGPPPETQESPEPVDEAGPGSREQDPPPAEDAPQTGEPTVEKKGPTPEALAAWSAIVGATTIPGEHQPITAFDLTADVRASQGAQTNQLSVRYRFLAPDFIRFMISDERETGRGPGKGAAAYWLRDGERITQLVGRDYKPDRDLVRRMTTIAQNVVALTDPARLTIQGLELRSAGPPFLPKSLAWYRDRLTWVEFQSPDFDLYRDEPRLDGATPQNGAPNPSPETPPDSPEPPVLPTDGEKAADPAPKRMFRVLVGADRKTHQPVLVALREEGEPGKRLGEPLLFELKDLRAVNGYYLPHTIFVRGFAPDQPVFQDDPAQEIGVIGASLAPKLTPADFQP